MSKSILRPVGLPAIPSRRWPSRSDLGPGPGQGRRRRSALLGGASAIALLTILAASDRADARCIGCSTSSQSAVNVATNGVIVGAQQATQIAANAQAALARATLAIQAMQ